MFNFMKGTIFMSHRPNLRDSNSLSLYNSNLDVPLISPVSEKEALYLILSI